MKPTTLIPLVVLVATLRAYGQTAPWAQEPDVVILRDGTRIEGRAVDVRLGEQATVRLPSGELRVVLWADVQTARGPSFEPPAGRRPPDAPTTATTPTLPSEHPDAPRETAARYLTVRPGTFPVILVADGEPLMISAIVESRALDPNLDPVPDPGDPIMPMFTSRLFGPTLPPSPSISPIRTQYLCTTPCTLYLVPGRATIHVGGIGRVESVQTIDVPLGGRRVTLYSSSSAVFGAAVGLTLLGAAASAAGSLALIADWTGNSGSVGGLPVLLLGILGIGVGSIAIAIGIPIIVRTRVGVERTTPLGSPERPPPRRTRVAGASVAPIAHGALAGFTLAF